MFFIAIKRNRRIDFIRNMRNFDRHAELRQRAMTSPIKIRYRFRLERDLPRTSIAGLNSELVVDEIKIDLESSRCRVELEKSLGRGKSHTA